MLKLARQGALSKTAEKLTSRAHMRRRKLPEDTRSIAEKGGHEIC
jgi:hypothetical protein